MFYLQNKNILKMNEIDKIIFNKITLEFYNGIILMLFTSKALVAFSLKNTGK